MNKIILIASLIAIYSSSFGQNTQSLESAFANGNAAEMHSQLASEVELNIGNDVHFLSSKETVQKLNQWFSKIKPSGFHGKIEGGSSVKYYSGQLKSDQGKYKVLVYFDGHDKNYKIDEIRIAKQ